MTGAPEAAAGTVRPPEAVMLFAAGRGTRMDASAIPKPMVEVAGRPLIDHALALADEAGIARRVANTHHLPEPLEAHLAGRGVTVLREAALLDTGGGLANARAALGGGAAFTLNTDAAWRGRDPLGALRGGWDGRGALLLLVPLAAARGRAAPGDFAIGPDGRLTPGGGLVYTGAQAIDLAVLDGAPEGAFSMWVLWDRLAERGLLRGLVWDGAWCDVGTPPGIVAAEEMLRDG